MRSHPVISCSKHRTSFYILRVSVYVRSTAFDLSCVNLGGLLPVQFVLTVFEREAKDSGCGSVRISAVRQTDRQTGMLWEHMDGTGLLWHDPVYVPPHHLAYLS
jgi:hypothetical protein